MRTGPEGQLYGPNESDVTRLRAEIERLREYACQCEASVHSTQQGYSNLQAEIERLNEENAHFAWRDKDKNKLITELADWISGPDGDEHWHPDTHTGRLLKRAREATKDE
jgi:FtsZ-binding cell division protein ZapB